MPYPYLFVQADVLDLPESVIAAADAVVSSPPCEDFARAHLPWLRGDYKPSDTSLHLLKWSISLTSGAQRRITECSRFAAMHSQGAVTTGCYALWGDVPPLLPIPLHRKSRLTGAAPAARALIDPHLAFTVAQWFTRSLPTTCASVPLPPEATKTQTKSIL